MSSMEKERLVVLNQISQGKYRKIGQVSYIVNNQKIHIKGKNGNLFKYPFNINPTVLEADYEVYICGSEKVYYIIPKKLILMMWDDPNAMVDRTHGYTILDVIPSEDRIVYGTGGKSIDISLYRSQSLSQINTILSNKNKYHFSEGKNHNNLKQWIAENPSYIGLENVEHTEIDTHTFPSGDKPDILFTYDSGSYATVEIETDNPIPGAYQSIKYRDLLCAELGIELLSPKVKTFLVAWEISQSLKEFCSKYSVHCYEKRI